MSLWSDDAERDMTSKRPPIANPSDEYSRFSVASSAPPSPPAKSRQVTDDFMRQHKIAVPENARLDDDGEPYVSVSPTAGPRLSNQTLVRHPLPSDVIRPPAEPIEFHRVRIDYGTENKPSLMTDEMRLIADQMRTALELRRKFVFMATRSTGHCASSLLPSSIAVTDERHLLLCASSDSTEYDLSVHLSYTPPKYKALDNANVGHKPYRHEQMLAV